MPNPFISLFRKEFYGWFSGWQAFFLISVYLILSLGVCVYAGDFFNVNNQNLYSLFKYQPQVLMLLLPAVSMHLWSDEKRRGTLDLLLTFPVEYKTLVLAKFFAAWTFCLLMLVCLLPLVVFYTFFAVLDISNVVWALITVFLTAGAFTAVGSAVSALCRNPVLAYIGSFFCLWVLTGTDPTPLLKEVAGLFAGQIFLAFGFQDMYGNMVSGQVGVQNVLYFILLIFMALWLNVVFVSERNGQGEK